MYLDDSTTKSPPRTLFSSLPAEIKSHSIRVGFLVQAMAKYYAEKYNFFGFDNENAMVMAILDGGQYHDIGKLMVSNNVLTKKANFTEAEKNTIRQHPLRSNEIISEFDNAFFKSEAHKQILLDMAKYHHERIDGNGYPYGLKGMEIPLISQLCGIADMFDIFVCTKVYKKQLKYDDVKKMILQSKGTAFCEEAVECFSKTYEHVKNNYIEKEKRLNIITL